MIAFCAIYSSASEYTPSPYRSTIKNYDEAYLAMYEAVCAGKEYVDITEYKITADEVIKIYGDLYQTSPELFYLDKQIRYYYNDTGLIHYVTRIYFSYTMELNEREEAIADYETEITYITSQIDVGLSDEEKALWVHDYFIASFEYDENETVYDAYSFLKERRGVCQAYSLAYMAVMREIGIDCFMITSQKMNHAWNIIKIDDEWYHIDIVFDDPAPNRIGRVMHEYFLLTDEEIENASTPHYGWVSKYSCTSTRFSDGFWRGINSRMLYYDGRWYYIDRDGLALKSRRYSDSEGIMNIIEFDEKWYKDEEGGEYWVGVFSGVSKFLGYIFVNTPKEILAYNAMTGRVSVFAEVKDGYIFGSNVYKNTLEYGIARSPLDEEYEIVKFEIKDFTVEYTKKVFPFTDVTKLDEEYPAIKYCYDHGLMNGVSSTRFAPDYSLTRAMFVTALGRLCEVNTERYTTVSYSDVKSGYWYSPYVEWASSIGLVCGVGDGKFAPLDVLTREQMYKVTFELCKLCGYGDSELDDVEIAYADAEEISDWAVDGVRFCIKNKITENDSSHMMPHSYATRGEVAVILYRLAGIVNAS